MRRPVLTALVCILFLPMTCVSSEPPRVETQAGPVVGLDLGGVNAWLGIPYAAAPVDELRWRPPQPVKAWQDPRSAQQFGSDCMQTPFPGDAAPLRTTPAEDCLFVNVWTADSFTPADKRPVMVWIHGGAFVNGGTSAAVYDGAPFARKGVVLVSINYRLGRFGFFAHPALSDEFPNEPKGNYALLDQIAALQWVQDNIAAFGGDPSNVTIFGESAGAISVYALAASPLANDLFQKVIMQSGVPRLRRLMPVYDLHGAKLRGLAFSRTVDIEGAGRAALAALRELPADTLVAGMNLANVNYDTYPGLMLDGHVLPRMPLDVFEAGEAAPASYLVGSNDLETGWDPVPEEQTQAMLDRFGKRREHVSELYNPDGTLDSGEVGVRLLTDELFTEPTRYLAMQLSRFHPTWLYRFGYVATSSRATQAGALHALEIPYVFDTVRASYGDATSPADEAAAARVHARWIAFARSGNPNMENKPHWPQYTRDAQSVMIFGTDKNHAVTDPWAARLDLWQGLSESRSAAGQ